MRGAVIPPVQGCLGGLQQPLRLGHGVGRRTAPPALLGRRHRLAGIAHLLHRCAGAGHQCKDDDKCGEPR